MNLTKLKVKICCIESVEEAQVAIALGASAIGLVGRMPSGPGVIDDKTIQAIAASVLPHVETFLLTSENTAADIIAHHRRTLTTAIQLVRRLHLEQYPKIRQALPGVKLVQVIHVEDEDALSLAMNFEPLADELLLDSGSTKLAVQELGGTGRTHDWNVSRKIVDAVRKPVYLAGGLTCHNVRQGVDAVRPHGVDVCSGVRTGGKLDSAKVASFMRSLSAGANF